MVSARPCITASQGMLASRAAVSRIETTARFASCPKICCSRPLSSKRAGFVVRAMSGESGPQGLPIDLRGNSSHLDISQIATVKNFFFCCVCCYSSILSRTLRTKNNWLVVGSRQTSSKHQFMAWNILTVFRNLFKWWPHMLIGVPQFLGWHYNRNITAYRLYGMICVLHIV